MPKLSKRQKFIKEISSLLKKRLAARQYRILFEEEDGIDEAAHCIDLAVAAAVVKAQIISDKPILVAQSNSNSTPKNFLIINLKLAAIRSFLGQSSGAWHSCWTAEAAFLSSIVLLIALTLIALLVCPTTCFNCSRFHHHW
eukprot:scaffold4109_cov59-Cylindrotheca_fusiformis.AAC.1